MGSDIKVAEDSSIVYTIIFVCVLAVLALIYKLYNKVNELAEKVENLVNTPRPLPRKTAALKEETPKPEETIGADPGPSKPSELVDEN